MTAPPHLLHIGFPKCGSKWLQRWFATHPGFHHDFWGLGGYRDIPALVRRCAVHAHDRCAVTSFEGLATPAEWYRDFNCSRREKILPRPRGRMRACKILSTLFPNAQVLIVTRGYRTLLRSAYAELVRGGAGCTPEAFLEGQAELAWRGRSPFDYDATIDLYAEAFGEARLTALPLELLADEPATFTRAIETAVGVAPHPPLDGTVHGGLAWTHLHWIRRKTVAIGRLPVPGRVRRALFDAHVRASRCEHGGNLVRVLARLSDRQIPFPEAALEDAVAALRGTSERLRGRPYYAPYAREYLLDE